MGNIRTAVAFALWGAGIDPERIPSITEDMSRLLTFYFRGDGDQAITKMGQFFFSHEAWELIFAAMFAGLGDVLRGRW